MLLHHGGSGVMTHMSLEVMRQASAILNPSHGEPPSPENDTFFPVPKGPLSEGSSLLSLCHRRGGHRMCVACACSSPKGTGPKALLSKLCPRWSPSTQACPRGTRRGMRRVPSGCTKSPSSAISRLISFCRGSLGESNDTTSPRCTCPLLARQRFRSTTS